MLIQDGKSLVSLIERVSVCARWRRFLLLLAGALKPPASSVMTIAQANAEGVLMPAAIFPWILAAAWARALLLLAHLSISIDLLSEIVKGFLERSVPRFFRPPDFGIVRRIRSIDRCPISVARGFTLCPSLAGLSAGVTPAAHWCRPFALCIMTHFLLPVSSCTSAV